MWYVVGSKILCISILRDSRALLLSYFQFIYTHIKEEGVAHWLTPTQDIDARHHFLNSKASLNIAIYSITPHTVTQSSAILALQHPPYPSLFVNDCHCIPGAQPPTPPRCLLYPTKLSTRGMQLPPTTSFLPVNKLRPFESTDTTVLPPRLNSHPSTRIIQKSR